MPGMSDEEAHAALFAPKTIYAPDGTTFVVQIRFDPSTSEEVFDNGLMRYELQGPGEGDHLWLADWMGEILPDPEHDDVPRIWTTKAELALSGWIQLSQAIGS